MRLGVEGAVVGAEVVPGDVEIQGHHISHVGVIPAGRAGLAVPGFIDLHTHGYAGVDFTNATPEQYRNVTKALTATGVTAFRPTLMSLSPDETMRALDGHSRADSDGAAVHGMHLEGPFLSAAHPGAHSPGSLLAPDLGLAEALWRRGRIGQVTLAPELEGAMELVSFFHGRGVTVSLGHSHARSDQAHAAFDLGAECLTHVFNASRRFEHRDPGIVGAALSRDDVYIEVILDGVHLSDEAAIVAIRSAGRRLVAVTDQMAAAGLGDGTYPLGDREVHVEKGEARLADGTIASSVLTMDDAFRKLLDLGSDLVAAVRACSTAPAELLGREDLGHIAPGKLADVVVLDDGYRVVRTLVAGEEHHTT